MVQFLHSFMKKDKHLKNHLLRTAIIYIKAASGSLFSRWSKPWYLGVGFVHIEVSKYTYEKTEWFQKLKCYDILYYLYVSMLTCWWFLIVTPGQFLSPQGVGHSKFDEGLSWEQECYICKYVIWYHPATKGA